MGPRPVGAIVAVLVLSGCTSSGGAWLGAAAAPVPAASSTGSGPPAATPTAQAGPSAADGTDVAACRDGRCEVLIWGKVTVPLDPRSGFAAITVTFVPPDRAELTGTDTQGGSFRGGISGSGQVGADGVVIQLVAVGPDGVVLRFLSR